MESSTMYLLITYIKIMILLMAVSTTFSREFDIHGNSVGTRDRLKLGGSVTSDDSLTSQTPTMIDLPQLLPMIIQYVFAKLWNFQDPLQKTPPGYCTPSQSRIIRDTCKIGPLSAGMASHHNGQKNRHGQVYADLAEFKKALDDICRLYSAFERCIRGWGVDKCYSDEKTVVIKLYSYLCENGRQELMVGNTGMCLSKLHRSDVIENLAIEGGCESSFGDMSSTIQTMLSVYHVHGDGDAASQKPAIRQHLYSLCRTWYTMSKCIFPAYASLCGDSAEKFYVGLLDTMKQSLVEEFHPLGQDIAELAKCNKTTGAKIKATPLPKVNNDAFMQYIRRQQTVYGMAKRNVRMRFGPCSPVTGSSSISVCFWSILATHGSALIRAFSNIATNQQIISQAFNDFSDCVEGSTSGCPPKNKIDFSDLAMNSNRMAAHADENIKCLDALSAVRISQDRCGLTLPDLFNYYTFEGALIFNQASSECTDNIPFQSFPELSCLTESVSAMAANASMYNETVDAKCISVLRDVNGLMTSLDNVTAQAARFFKNVYFTSCHHDEID